MKNEIKNDLEELVSLIESEEDFAKLIDTTPIQNAINSLASSKNCFYDIQNLSFDINKKIKKIHPAVDKVTLIINNKVHYQDTGGIIYIGDYNLDIVIYGYKNRDKYQYCWHLDKHITKGNDRYSHPVFHFQAGGKLADISLNSPDTLYIGMPRVPHPPMDIFLVINFILANFYDKKVYKFVNSLLANERYCQLIKKAQSRIVDPYLKGIFDPKAHNDYNINTIYPTYIQ